MFDGAALLIHRFPANLACEAAQFGDQEDQFANGDFLAGAQVDRFGISFSLGYPEASEEAPPSLFYRVTVTATRTPVDTFEIATPVSVSVEFGTSGSISA